jgi:NADH:ubiquinone reductase (non-electrogenic)
VQIPRQRLQQSFRRTYAEVSPETQRVVKKRGFRFLRWTWRLTYLSALGGLVFVGYQIYQGRTPADQVDPDPTKKTLVVLGKLIVHEVVACHQVKADDKGQELDGALFRC